MCMKRNDLRSQTTVAEERLREKMGRCRAGKNL